MCVCVYVCMYVCMDGCMHGCMDVGMYVCMYLYFVYIYIYIHIYTHVCMYVYMRVCVCVSIYIYIYMYTCMYAPLLSPTQACITYGRGEVYTGFWWGNMRARDHIKDPGVEGRILLKWVFRKWDVFHGLDRYGSGQGLATTGTFKCGNEIEGSIKCGEFLD